MDRSACEALIEKHAQALLEFLGVSHWRVTIKTGVCEDPETTADCTRNAPYDIARITINPEMLGEDEEFFLDTLFHEITHIVLAPFDVYRHHYTAMLQPKSIEDKQEDFLWAYSVEQAVINLERLWRRHLKAVYLKQIETPTEAAPAS